MHMLDIPEFIYLKKVIFMLGIIIMGHFVFKVNVQN